MPGRGGQLGEFLGWYMIRKVTAGQDLLKAAGTVTKKLSAWLKANSHISDLDGQGWLGCEVLAGSGGSLCAAAFAGQQGYERRWLPDPPTGEIAFWARDSGLEGEAVDLEEVGLVAIHLLPSWVWYQEMVDFCLDSHPDPGSLTESANGSNRPGTVMIRGVRRGRIRTR